jgi:hypothetical protein
MDLKNLISRIELAASLHVYPQTIAKWTWLGLFRSRRNASRTASSARTAIRCAAIEKR